MIAHLRGREQALEPLGWKERKAEWIALACLHSGAFTRAQATRFLDRHHERARRLVHALIAHGLAAEETVPRVRGIGRVCRIYARSLYRALGAEHIRHRRTASPGVLIRRLLSLDYVIEHTGLPWLATEHEKVGAFEALGIEPASLPVRVYRGAAGATRRYFRSNCPSRWTRAAPCSYTSIPATTPRPRSAPGERRTAGSGSRSRDKAGPSRSSPSRAPRGRSSEPDAGIREELARIERAILQGAVQILEEFGGLQAAMKRSVVLEKQVRRQPGPGSIRRASTWRTVRLAGARYR